ncbi:hypothetical protein FRC12_001048 [Ceratobasidium sp. 428]|nr:hypothetical protein FRC12_001048 [Ceratobasidium sp. 428]
MSQPQYREQGVTADFDWMHKKSPWSIDNLPSMPCFCIYKGSAIAIWKDYRPQVEGAKHCIPYTRFCKVYSAPHARWTMINGMSLAEFQQRNGPYALYDLLMVLHGTWRGVVVGPSLREASDQLIDPLPPTIAINEEGNASNQRNVELVMRSPRTQLPQLQSVVHTPTPTSSQATSSQATSSQASASQASTSSQSTASPVRPRTSLNGVIMGSGPSRATQLRWRQERINGIINPCLVGIYNLGRFSAAAELMAIEQLVELLADRHEEIRRSMAPEGANATEENDELEPEGANATDAGGNVVLNGPESSPDL